MSMAAARLWVLKSEAVCGLPERGGAARSVRELRLLVHVQRGSHTRVRAESPEACGGAGKAFSGVRESLTRWPSRPSWSLPHCRRTGPCDPKKAAPWGPSRAGLGPPGIPRVESCAQHPRVWQAWSQARGSHEGGVKPAARPGSAPRCPCKKRTVGHTGAEGTPCGTPCESPGRWNLCDGERGPGESQACQCRGPLWICPEFMCVTGCSGAVCPLACSLPCLVTVLALDPAGCSLASVSTGR